MAKIPSDYMERIEALHKTTGEVMQQWAYLELSLMLLLAQLLNGDQFRARIVWLSMPNMRARLDLIRRLGETFLDESLIQEFRAILRRCKNLGKNRNSLAHNAGGLDVDAVFTYYQDEDTDDNGIDFTGTGRMPLANILDWPQQIKDLNATIVTFAHGTLSSGGQLVQKMHSSPRIQRELFSDHRPKNAK